MWSTVQGKYVVRFVKTTQIQSPMLSLACWQTFAELSCQGYKQFCCNSFYFPVRIIPSLPPELHVHYIMKGLVVWATWTELDQRSSERPAGRRGHVEHPAKQSRGTCGNRTPVDGIRKDLHQRGPTSEPVLWYNSKGPFQELDYGWLEWSCCRSEDVSVFRLVVRSLSRGRYLEAAGPT